MSDLVAFLQKKKSHVQDSFQKETEWTDALYALSLQLEEWLKEASSLDLLDLERRVVLLHEEEFGDYGAISLQVTFGVPPRVVHVLPVARNAKGARGRVDMVGRFASSRTQGGDAAPCHLATLLRDADGWFLQESCKRRSLDRRLFEDVLLAFLQDI